MLEIAARVVLGAVLAYSAAHKAARPRESIAAMASYGFAGGGRTLAWAIALTAEAALAVGILAGSERAAWAGAALMALYAATMGSALMRGAAGRPCGCFGLESQLGWAALARAVVLTAAFATLAATL